jgi:predicted DNA repair protein MutK
MNTTFFYALVLAASNIVLTLVGFFLGYQTDKMAEGRWFAWLSLVVGIVVTWLGVRAVREDSADKSLAYGKGVVAGFMINLYAGIVGSIYGFIHFTFINPNFVDYAIDQAKQKAVNASDAQLATMEKGMRFMMSPVVLSIWGFVMALVFGILVALVVSAFLKRTPQTPVEAPPPAA